MSTHQESSTTRERYTVYIVVGIVVVALAVIGLIAYRGHEKTEEAQAKADELIAAIEAAGYHAPSQDQVIGVLGSDGGATCADPSSALTSSALRSMIANGAAGPGARPVIADDLIVKGQLLVIEIYCPDELPAFEEIVNNFDFDDVVKH